MISGSSTAYETTDPPPGAVGYLGIGGSLAPATTTAWGAAIGFLLYSTGVNYWYDASGYSGVSFWMKPSATSTATAYQFAVLTSATLGYSDGAYAMIARDMPPAGVWTNVQVRWTDLAPAPWATATEMIPFKPSTVTGMQWTFPSGPTEEPFDISIGGIDFLP
jgi:hypothetical protein